MWVKIDRWKPIVYFNKLQVFFLSVVIPTESVDINIVDYEVGRLFFH